MRSYEFGGVSINPQGIDYAVMKYTAFEAREVLRDSKAIGEWHVKINDGSNLLNAVKYFQKQFEGEEVGLIDPDNMLNLEYSIYLKIKNQIILNSVVDIFNQIDSELNNSVRD